MRVVRVERTMRRFMSSLNGMNGSPRGRFPVRRDWSLDEVRRVYSQNLLELMYQGATAHREHFNPQEVQKCTLLSIKTGGCPEDCKYCSQSSKYKTSVKAEMLMQVDDVLAQAKKAKDAGSTRFCMGAAWRGASQVGPRQFQRVLDMVTGVREMGLEVCATLGLVNAEQARMLKEAGLTAYNHNLDTSREFYPKVITTRNYDDRLQTLQNVREAGISVCCGGIIGLGESHQDRVSMIHTLATLPKHPESVPVNALVVNEGTPLEGAKPLPVWDLVRMIAAARVIMPASMVRLSAGRVSLSPSEQALCFFAGANSIFTGDKLLTTPNSDMDEDKMLFETLGIRGKPPVFAEEEEQRDDMVAAQPFIAEEEYVKQNAVAQ
uniref:biotin synthase n=1 Tax=Rhodosorus marinus TaxID=101924 RepID=A0A7S2ZKB4_9RHOD|mmetsp:Transcript_22684/g.90892  ORF Transcript_22684/g.90892 Transcript_22684/m.90892 type:complete len:378 (+) Transcript_22684:62-1195(+)